MAVVHNHVLILPWRRNCKIKSFVSLTLHLSLSRVSLYSERVDMTRATLTKES
ncbi:hypothetical protein ARUE_c13050 [Arthrobacter sp. Rue61a]|nr:hypothetical protein ARUE_c13050 [Arthrobacter sp. Rue61a]